MMKTKFDVELPLFKEKTMLADLGLGATEDSGPESKIILPHKKPTKSKNNPSPALTEEQKKRIKRTPNSALLLNRLLEA